MKIKHNAFLGMSLNVYNKMTNPGFFYSIAKAFMPSDEVSKHLINVPREFLLDAPSLTMSNLTIHLQYYSKINQIKARLHDLINPQEFNPFIETALHALPAKEKIIIHTKGLNELSQILEVPGLDRTDVQTFFLLHEFSHLIDYRNSHKKENDFEKFNHCLAHVGLDDLKNAHEKDAKYQYISLQALRMGQIVKGGQR